MLNRDLVLLEGAYTQQCTDRMWELASAQNIEPLTPDEFRSISSTELFKVKLFDRLIQLGYDGSCENLSAAEDFLNKLIDKAQVSIGPKTIRSWLTKGTPATTSDGRKNLFRLCFALQMNAKETTEFFLKAVSEPFFNFKDLFEAACYFCMKTERSYTDVENLVRKTQSQPLNDFDFEVIESTTRVGDYLEEIQTEDEFVSFWLDHAKSFEVHKKSASAKTLKLLEQCYYVASKYIQKFRMEDVHGPIETPDKLLSVIYGFPVRSTRGGSPLYQVTISKSDFPKSITKNFPQTMQLQHIKDGTASYDELRKTIILLTFFKVFAERRVNDDEDGDPFDDFVVETERRLFDCGYVGLYVQNPYDWMFCFCAMQFEENPIDKLQAFIYEFYTRPYSVDEGDEE